MGRRVRAPCFCDRAIEDLEGAQQRHDTLAASDNPETELVGGTYRLLRRIGAGAMGIVHEAEHVRLRRRYAVKILRVETHTDTGRVERFFREARLIAQVQDEHIVNIVDCGQLADGTPFLVTELLVGQDLRRRLSEAKVLTLREALQIANHACRALSAVHAAGIVHRDIKPENLFLTQRTSGAPVCKLLDFGVAKLTSRSSTARGALIGTIGYMAPEQILDSSRVGPQADVYSLGAILFECLAGRPPHTASTAEGVIFKAVHSPAPDVRDFRPDVPVELAHLIERALTSDLRRRFDSAAQMADALALIATGALVEDCDGDVREHGPKVGMEKPVSVPAVRPNQIRSRAWAGAAVATGAVMTLATVFVFSSNRQGGIAPAAVASCAVASTADSSTIALALPFATTPATVASTTSTMLSPGFAMSCLVQSRTSVNQPSSSEERNSTVRADCAPSASTGRRRQSPSASSPSNTTAPVFWGAGADLFTESPYRAHRE